MMIIDCFRTLIMSYEFLLTVNKHLLCLTNFKMYLLVNNEHLFLLKGLERAFLLITRTFIQSFTKME